MKSPLVETECSKNSDFLLLSYDSLSLAELLGDKE